MRRSDGISAIPGGHTPVLHGAKTGDCLLSFWHTQYSWVIYGSEQFLNLLLTPIVKAFGDRTMYPSISWITFLLTVKHT